MTLASIAWALTCSIASAQSRPPRTVLTIHSGTADFFVNPVLDAGIRETLGARADLAIDYYAEYLESERFVTVRTIFHVPSRRFQVSTPISCIRLVVPSGATKEKRDS